MKHAFRLILAGLTAGLLSTLTAAATPTPTDTLLGQAHLVRRMSAGMCDRLTKESQKIDLAKLTSAESEALFKRILLKTMGENYAEFNALLEKAGTTSQAELGRIINEQSIIEIAQRCPIASTLMVKVSERHAGISTEITPAERPTLLAITRAVCKQLDEENAKKPFSNLTPAQRGALLQRVLVGTCLKSADELMAQYGDEVMEDEAQGEEIGKKIAVLMVEVCPVYILQAGQENTVRSESAITPAPATKPSLKNKASATKKSQ